MLLKQFQVFARAPLCKQHFTHLLNSGIIRIDFSPDGNLNIHAESREKVRGIDIFCALVLVFLMCLETRHNWLLSD